MREFLRTFEKFVSFKKWSRKKYAAFASFGKVIKICKLLITYTIITGKVNVSAQSDTLSIEKNIDLEEVEITGQWGPEVYSAVSRVVTVITKEDIESAPVQNLNEILEYVLNVDIIQRGAFGVQSDISIRGGTYDNVLILLNGINVSDPQTGHFSLDLPVDLESIERIEVLNGPGARVYGSNALTGAVNIITNKVDSKKFSISALAGQYGFLKGSVSAQAPMGKFTNQICYSGSRSDGYAHNTDFAIHNLFYNGSYTINDNSFEITAGYNIKEFGANAFYSPRFPDQYEEGNVFFAGIKFNSGKTLKFSPHLYWRRKKDHFILIKDNPEIYQNFHITDMSGLSLNWSFQSKAGSTFFGAGLRNENIISNNIGLVSQKTIKVKGEDSIYYDHRYLRANIDFFLEHTFYFKNIQISGGAMLNWNNDYPDKAGIYPGIDISYSFLNHFKFFTSYNRAVHFPTFTDLFYTDPNNQGNINLKPNTLSSYEVGLKLNYYLIKGQVALFHNTGHDIIDWLWNSPVNKFEPVNIPEFNVSGIEVSAKLDMDKKFKKASVEYITVNYSYTDVNKNITDSVAKYYNIRNKLNIGVQNKIFKKLKSRINLAYQDRAGSYITFDTENNSYVSNSFEPFWLLDGRLFWESKKISIYVEASNIFNTEYIDSRSLIQPGRWIRTGVKISL